MTRLLGDATTAMAIRLKSSTMGVAKEIGREATALKILVVDDEDDILFFLERIFEKYHVEFFTAKNGRDALFELEKNSPDILLLDIKMPVMDGFECISKIRISRKRAINVMPTIAMTAFSSPEFSRKIIQAGFNDYLFKPFDIDDLIKSIERQTGMYLEKANRESGRT